MRLHHVVFAPTMPMGLEKLFSFKNLFLARGFKVTLLDTLSLFSSNATLEGIPSLTAKFKGALL